MANSRQSNDEIDVKELLLVLWSGRWWLVFITTLISALTVAVVLWLPSQYRATTVLAPTASASANGSLSQLSGLASLAGISLGSGSGDESQVALELMQSWGFIDQFIRDNQLEVQVFAVNGWDRETSQVKIDGTLYSVTDKKWMRDPPKGKTVEPTSWELYEEFSDRLSVSQDKTTGLVTVSFEYYSPLLAKEILEKYVSAINEQMRARKLAESQQNVTYLEEQIAKTSVAELKEVFYKLVEEEIKGRMLAEARPEYSFISVSAAMTPEEASRPRRVLIVVFAALFGIILSTVVVLVRSALRSKASGV